MAGSKNSSQSKADRKHKKQKRSTCVKGRLKTMKLNGDKGETRKCQIRRDGFLPRRNNLKDNLSNRESDSLSKLPRQCFRDRKEATPKNHPNDRILMYEGDKNLKCLLQCDLCRKAVSYTHLTLPTIYSV